MAAEGAGCYFAAYYRSTTTYRYSKFANLASKSLTFYFASEDSLIAR